ncbi:MAG: hypothetical protein HY286_08985 [Planctomycetes bacterium]|nr:hypothetical protein [Planctomycetota bacterium]
MFKTLAIVSCAVFALLTAPIQAQSTTLNYVSPTPPTGSTFTIMEGQTINVDVALVDTDPTQTVAFQTTLSPLGCIESPPSPQIIVGDGINPVVCTCHLTWTAPVGSAGQQFLFLYDAADSPGGARLPAGFAVNVNPAPIQAGDFISYTQGGWGSKPAGNNPGMLLKNNFTRVYQLGCLIGVQGITGFWLRFMTASNIQKFLPAGGTPKALNASAVNPTSSNAGVFAGQVLALKLNCDFSFAGITLKTGGPLGLVKLTNTGNSQLDGVTIYQVLFAAQLALSGGQLMFGIASISQFNDLVTNLNEAFDNGGLSGWAQTHLTK